MFTLRGNPVHALLSPLREIRKGREMKDLNEVLRVHVVGDGHGPPLHVPNLRELRRERWVRLRHLGQRLPRRVA